MTLKKKFRVQSQATLTSLQSGAIASRTGFRML